MKNYLFFVLILLSQLAKAQVIEFPVDSLTNKVTYQNIVEVKGKSQNDLYDNALSWVSKSFKSSKAVIDLADRDMGKIVLKPILSQTWSNAIRIFEIGSWKYSVTILVKDNKYKYVITDFYHTAIDSKSLGSIESDPQVSTLSWPNRKVYAYMIDSLNNNMLNLMQSLEYAMTQKSEKDF